MIRVTKDRDIQSVCRDCGHDTRTALCLSLDPEEEDSGDILQGFIAMIPICDTCLRLLRQRVIEYFVSRR